MKLNDAINKILDYELDEEHYSAMPTEFWVNEEFIMTCIGNGHNTTAVYNYIFFNSILLNLKINWYWFLFILPSKKPLYGFPFV